MALTDAKSDLKELLQAQAHIWNHTFNFINSMSLKCGIELGIPDIIHSHGKPMTLPELIAALPIHSTKTHHLSRLMSLLVHSGFFALKKLGGDDQKEEGYVLTPASCLLLKDKDNIFSIRPFVQLILDPLLVDPWQYMSTWFQNEEPTAFKTAFGESFWEKALHEPRLTQLVNETTASDCLLVSRVVISKCKGVFEGLKSLVDVGGGTGNMAKAIAEAFPNLHCTVFDQPHVVSGLQGGKNLKYVGGDMFEAIPSADAALVKWVMHDWNDEDCIKILKRCKEAITSDGKGGKVIIIDMVMGNQNWDKKSVETQFFFDLESMVNISGRQRNEKDWAKLFSEAGFSNYTINPVLGIRALIEIYP